MKTHKCISCGAYNTYEQTEDNQVCTECGDTEGYKDVEEDTETFYSTLTQGSLDPKGYLEIHAPSENDARIISRVVLDKDWAFIYPEEQFDGQVEEYDLHPINKSPIIVTKDDMWHYKSRLKEKETE